ncbi:YIP1 family protein [Planktotalea sp.]|uniref:YIP1 family protein n=1 Tax=Planktotalea sp. TaxID=2029877 RepID=UPI0025CE4B10|nr:YIP1 family protein [Planktotalea sp.]
MPVSSDIVATYRGPRTAIARILSTGQREDRALMILMSACLIAFIARWPALARQAHISGEDLNMLLGGALLAWLFIAPLALYAIGAFTRIVAKVLRGKGNWYGARMALFWALLASSPLMLLNGLVEGLIGPGPGLQVVGFLWFVTFIWFWVSGLIEAERPN